MKIKTLMWMALVLLFYQWDNATFAQRTKVFKNLRKKEVFGLNVLYIYLYRLDYYRLFNEAQGSPFGF